MTPALSLEQTAEAIGYSADRFRKVWRKLQGFPKPFREPSIHRRGRYAWLAADIEAWRLTMKDRHPMAVRQDPQPTPANDRQTHRLEPANLARQRQLLGRMMAGAR